MPRHIPRQITLGKTPWESLWLFRVDKPLSGEELQSLRLANSPFEPDPGNRHANAVGWPYGNLVQNTRDIQIFGFDADYYSIEEWLARVQEFAPQIGAVVVGGISNVSTELAAPYF